MTTTATRRQSMDHDAWMAAAEQEYRRLLDLLRALDPGDWARPTDCSEWDVRQLVAHLVGAAECMASVRETARQGRLGKRLRPGADGIDGMTAVQVQERAGATPAELLAALQEAAPRAVRARRRLPAVVRAVRVPFGPPLGVRSVGYLMDRIYTRDAWMHRVDLARATGREPVLTADHDGRIVADVVEEWARTHRDPYHLVLTGPAGGTFGDAAQEPLQLDAVEFCRLLSGRGTGTGLLATRVPF